MIEFLVFGKWVVGIYSISGSFFLSSYFLGFFKRKGDSTSNSEYLTQIPVLSCPMKDRVSLH